MSAPLHASKEYVNQFFTTASVAARPTSWKIALHTGDPGTGDNNEVPTGSTTYARQSVTFSASEDSSGKFYEAKSMNDVVFPDGGAGDDYTVTHYTIRDGATGNALATAQLSVPIPVSYGVPVVFPKNYIKVRGV